MSAFQVSVVEVGTSATEVLSGLEGRFQVIVQAPDNFEVWLGGSSVTSGTGFPLQYLTNSTGNVIDGVLSRMTMDVLLDSTDALYAVASTTNVPVTLLVNPR